MSLEVFMGPGGALGPIPLMGSGVAVSSFISAADFSGNHSLTFLQGTLTIRVGLSRGPSQSLCWKLLRQRPGRQRFHAAD